MRRCRYSIFISLSASFAMGVLLMYFCSLKLALFISSLLLVTVCRMALRQR